jgi:hypothetical protein
VASPDTSLGDEAMTGIMKSDPPSLKMLKLIDVNHSIVLAEQIGQKARTSGGA